MTTALQAAVFFFNAQWYIRISLVMANTRLVVANKKV